MISLPATSYHWKLFPAIFELNPGLMHPPARGSDPPSDQFGLRAKESPVERMVKCIATTLLRLPSHLLPTSSHELLDLTPRVPDSGTGLTGFSWDGCVLLWAILTYFLASNFDQNIHFVPTRLAPELDVCSNT